MSKQSSGAAVRIGLPIEAVAGAIASAQGGGESRIYLEFPSGLLRAAMPEVVGHSVAGSGDELITLELDDEDFNVSGAASRA